MENQHRNGRKQILTANDLCSGSIVYLSASGWNSSINQASLLDDSDVDTALRAASDQVAEVIGAYPVEVTVTSSGLQPIKLRERLRALNHAIREDRSPAGVS